MTEQNYAFIKDNNVVDIIIFDNPSSELLELFKSEHSVDQVLLANDKTVIGGTFDGSKFWEPKPYESWIKNEELGEWEAPVAYPEPEHEGIAYLWNENTLSWDKIENIEEVISE